MVVYPFGRGVQKKATNDSMSVYLRVANSDNLGNGVVVNFRFAPLHLFFFLFFFHWVCSSSFLQELII
jgi:hypothetical protein